MPAGGGTARKRARALKKIPLTSKAVNTKSPWIQAAPPPKSVQRELAKRKRVTPPRPAGSGPRRPLPPSEKRVQRALAQGVMATPAQRRTIKQANLFARRYNRLRQGGLSEQQALASITHTATRADAVQGGLAETLGARIPLPHPRGMASGWARRAPHSITVTPLDVLGAGIGGRVAGIAARRGLSLAERAPAAIRAVGKGITSTRLNAALARAEPLARPSGREVLKTAGRGAGRVVLGPGKPRGALGKLARVPRAAAVTGYGATVPLAATGKGGPVPKGVARLPLAAPLATWQGVTHPGATTRGFQQALVGIPVGLAYAAAHPEKAIKMMRDDLVHRYGPLYRGDTAQFNRIAAENGLTPYALDAIGFGGGFSQVIGRLGGKGLLGRAFQNWMGHRPELALGSLRLAQRPSHGVLGRAGQHFLDFARRHNNGGPFGPAEVGAVRPLLARREIAKLGHIAGRNRAQSNILANRRYAGAVKKLLRARADAAKRITGIPHDLRDAALHHVVIHGIHSPEDFVRIASLYHDLSHRERLAAGFGDTPHELAQVAELSKHPEYYTESLSAARDQYNQVTAHLAEIDPAVGEMMAQNRRWGPLAMTLRHTEGPGPGAAPAEGPPAEPLGPRPTDFPNTVSMGQMREAIKEWERRKAEAGQAAPATPRDIFGNIRHPMQDPLADIRGVGPAAEQTGGRGGKYLAGPISGENLTPFDAFGGVNVGAGEPKPGFPDPPPNAPRALQNNWHRLPENVRAATWATYKQTAAHLAEPRFQDISDLSPEQLGTLSSQSLDQMGLGLGGETRPGQPGYDAEAAFVARAKQMAADVGEEFTPEMEQTVRDFYRETSKQADAEAQAGGAASHATPDPGRSADVEAYLAEDHHAYTEDQVREFIRNTFESDSPEFADPMSQASANVLRDYLADALHSPDFQQNLFAEELGYAIRGIEDHLDAHAQATAAGEGVTSEAARQPGEFDTTAQDIQNLPEAGPRATPESPGPVSDEAAHDAAMVALRTLSHDDQHIPLYRDVQAALNEFMSGNLSAEGLMNRVTAAEDALKGGFDAQVNEARRALRPAPRLPGEQAPPHPNVGEGVGTPMTGERLLDNTDYKNASPERLRNLIDAQSIYAQNAATPGQRAAHEDAVRLLREELAQRRGANRADAARRGHAENFFGVDPTHQGASDWYDDVGHITKSGFDEAAFNGQEVPLGLIDWGKTLREFSDRQPAQYIPDLMTRPAESLSRAEEGLASAIRRESQAQIDQMPVDGQGRVTLWRKGTEPRPGEAVHFATTESHAASMKGDGTVIRYKVPKSQLRFNSKSFPDIWHKDSQLKEPDVIATLQGDEDFQMKGAEPPTPPPQQPPAPPGGGGGGGIPPLAHGGTSGPGNEGFNPLPETPEEWAAVRERAHAAGLHGPGYWPSQFKPELRSKVKQAFQLQVMGGTLKYTGAVYRLGMEDAHVQHLLRAAKRSTARSSEWNRAADEIMANALPYTGSPTELIQQFTRDGINPEDVAIVNRNLLRTGAENPDLNFPGALDHAIWTPGSNPADFAEIHELRVIPRAVTDALVDVPGQRGAADGSGALRVNHFLKSKASRVILGSVNVPWLQFQILSNVAMTGLARTGPFDIARSIAWWKGLSDNEKAAMEPYLGQGHFTWETTSPQVFKTDTNNRLVLAYRAFKQGQVQVPFTKRHLQAQHLNPLNWMFAGDRFQNAFFRRAVLYSQIRRDAYTRLGASYGKVDAAQARIMQQLSVGPEEQIAAVLRDPKAMQEHAQHVNDFLGDYLTFSKAEQRVLANNVMFYAFLRYSLRLVFYTMPVRHPVVAAILGKLGQWDPQDTKKLLGPGLLPYMRGAFYTKSDGSMAVDFSRANPALSALTQTSTLPGVLSSVLPPHMTILLDNVLRQHLFTGKPFKLGPSSKGLTYSDRFPLNERLKVALRDVLQMYYPYRTAERILAGGRPVASDSLLIRPKYTKYKQIDITSSIGKDVKRQHQHGLLRQLIQEISIGIPKPSPNVGVAKDRVKPKTYGRPAPGGMGPGFTQQPGSGLGPGF